MKKVYALGLGLAAAMMMTGCAVESHNPNQPAMFADKGSYFKQDTTKSLAANLVAFSGYPHLISDHDMPSDLKAGLDFTSGAYMGFNGFGSLFGAGGIGLLSMVSDNTLPYQHGVVVVMAKVEAGEKYNDYSVAERAIKASFKKASDEYLKGTSYLSKPEIKVFLADTDMNGMKCHKPGGLNFTGRDAVCDFGDSDFGLSVIFSRPATGQEFPELGVLPKGEYSVMLLSTMRYPMYELRGDAWAAKYNSDGFMQFKNLKLPFLSPDKSGKRIAFATENGKESVIYLN